MKPNTTVKSRNYCRIDAELSQKIEDVSIRVYDATQLKGIVRMDFIIDGHNRQC